MEDSENKKEEVQQNEPKKTEPKKTEKAAKKKGGFFRSLKAEFKRCVWPEKDRIIKETTAVVIVTVILGAVIALLDFVIKAGLDKIIQIG
ncbi:MAG: preprotein translocase subunit SecE [Clostridiaceae bacterium]|nr:preprotein translocase subunit SecE [Clostridiaceae bacterium]